MSGRAIRLVFIQGKLGEGGGAGGNIYTYMGCRVKFSNGREIGEQSLCPCEFAIL